MDASEIFAKRLNAKEAFTPMSGEKFIFPTAHGKVKLSGGDQVLRTSTSIRDSPDRGEEQGNLQGESDGSSSPFLRDSSWYDGKAMKCFFLVHFGQLYLPSPRGTQSQTVRAERRIISYSTEIYRRYQDYGYNIRWTLVHFGSQTFVPISWVCKKQTSVSHSSTEAEIISVDAGLRMDGIPAIDLWDLVMEAFHSSPNQINKSKD